MVETDACWRLSRTAVNSAPLSSACVACVWRIQCGLARRGLPARGHDLFNELMRSVYLAWFLQQDDYGQ